MKNITYSASGVDYSKLDKAKIIAQRAAKKTGINFKLHDMTEIGDTRGEAAFVWQQGNTLMASVTESLGTKNLVADQMRSITGKTYYDVIGNDTVAAIINDLISVGAKPLVVNALWAVGESAWFEDQERIHDLVNGWKNACDSSKVVWGGGESPSYNDIVIKGTVALGGSAVGIIKNKSRLVLETKLKTGDRIILIKSNGINANGVSLARAVAKQLKSGFATKLPSGKLFGEAILTTTNIYAGLIDDLFNSKIDIRYISNITGHGLRKIMRAKGNFKYILEHVFDPQEVFLFIQKHTGLSDDEMYQTYNMGQDYAIFVSPKDVNRTLRVINKNGFVGLDAGYIEKGKKQVVLKPKRIIFSGETLDLRV